MKILVTGGAGFIGSHIVDELVRQKHDVRVIDNLDQQVHLGKKPEYLNPKAEYIFDDIRNHEIRDRAFEDMEVVFHEAAAVGVGQSMYQIGHYVHCNTYATADMLEYIVNSNHPIKKIIVASSMSIYGEGAYECDDCGVIYPRLRAEEQMKKHVWEMLCPSCGKAAKPIPTSEDKPLYPTSIYAITKRDQEEMCLSIGRAYGIPTVALRYFNVYGPRQSLSNPYTGVAAIFSSRVKNDNPPMIFEDGMQTRDFISIKDIVKANMLVMENKSADYGMFNVGTGVPTSILDIASTLIELYKKDFKPNIVNKFRAGDIRHCYADISKIKKLGFKPTVSLEDGMRGLKEWGETAEAEDMSDKAHKELVSRELVEE